MNRFRFPFVAAALAVALLLPTRAEELPAAQGLLDDVVRSLPDRPLLVNAQLQVKTADGQTDRRLQLEMLLDWQADPPQARYTIRDQFNKTRAYLGLTWPTGQKPQYTYLQGDPLTGAPTPPLGERIEGTDITWIDLSLSFLHWRGGRTTGQEEVRGRDCYVVDIDAPAGTPGYSGVRLWIEPKIHMLLRAESYNEKIELVRRLDVRSFQKINDRWFVGKIDVQSFPSRHHTYLQVKSVFDRERKQYLTKDQATADEAPANRVIDRIEIPAATAPAPAP